MDLKDFKTLARNYKVIWFDSYGVLKNHAGVIPGIRETLQMLNEAGIEFYVLTNDASRSPLKLAQKYQDAGVKEIQPEMMISSGMLARDYLEAKVKGGIVAYLGTPESAHYIRTAGMETLAVSEMNLKEADNVNALVLLDDEGFDWERDLNKAVNLLRVRNIPVVVANSDRTYPVSGGQVAIAIGGLANMMEQMVSKKFLRFGKPDTQMFHYAYSQLRPEISKKDILMVGDTLLTDILGGNKFGIDTALVLTGNTLGKKVNSRIEITGIIPTYIAASVGKQ
ncbi:MAG: TIGR01459 family HAD-type hydrolase [Bacteroidota bacterium]